MMRWIFAVVGLVVMVPAASAQDNAQKLYEAMEQKLSKAKAHSFNFDLDAKHLEYAVKVKGYFILAPGNRFVLNYEGMERDRKIMGRGISDGKMMVMLQEDDANPETKFTPDNLTKEVSTWLIRSGLFLAVMVVFDRGGSSDVDMFKLSDFKLLGKEKVGDREANVIEYKLLPRANANNVTATCKLWIDAKTNMPLKRITEFTRDGNKNHFRAVETYSQWELDPALSDGLFALPK